MQFLSPVQISDGNLLASSIPETDHPAWAAGVTYALGARVVNAHRVWQSVVGGNVGHDPALDAAAEYWVDVGPTGRWAMFDASVGTVSAAAGDIVVSLQPGFVSALALLDVTGSAVRVQMSSAGAPVYDRTFAMSDNAELLDYWMYFFAPITPSTVLVVPDLPPFEDGVITVTISPSSGLAACGTLAVGDLVEVGAAQYGARLGVIDYSRKETDEWGVTAVTERGYAKRFEPSVLIPARSVDYVARQLAAVRARPVIWVGIAQYESTVVFGWLRDWGITISYPTHSVASITIEGLV